MTPADQLRTLVRALVSEAVSIQAPGQITRRQAIVESIIPGPPKRVTLKFSPSDPTSFPAAYLAWYTPALGDTVWVDFVGPDPLVLGKQA